ncbi:hypothetical protein V6N13_133250 [Hibiscus sabdariffa]
MDFDSPSLVSIVLSTLGVMNPFPSSSYIFSSPLSHPSTPMLRFPFNACSLPVCPSLWLKSDAESPHLHLRGENEEFFHVLDFSTYLGCFGFKL